MDNFLDWRNFQGSQPEKFYKTTLWQGEQIMVGLNCLEPGQEQAIHTHAGADKFYFVVEGTGQFTIGSEEKSAVTGTLVLAPSGVAHGVRNTSNERLCLLVTISPGIK